jgi:hypothetical protein
VGSIFWLGGISSVTSAEIARTIPHDPKIPELSLGKKLQAENSKLPEWKRKFYSANDAYEALWSNQSTDFPIQCGSIKPSPYSPKQIGTIEYPIKTAMSWPTLQNRKMNDTMGLRLLGILRLSEHWGQNVAGRDQRSD